MELKFVFPLTLALFAIISLTNGSSTPTPIVLWHGLGDWSKMKAIKGFTQLLQEERKGVYILSLSFGKNKDEKLQEEIRSFFGDVNDQVNDACERIKSDPKLKDGFNAIGFSQGGQFLRGLVQKCSGSKMNHLITLGSQHQGVYGIPDKFCNNSSVCETMRQLVYMGAYIPWIQKHVIQAQYWHDPYHESIYRKKSIFIADINNELKDNKEYKENLLQLKQFVMVQFNEDEMVTPIESSSFGFYDKNINVIGMNQTDIYLKDRIGLKKLNEEGRLKIIKIPGQHIRFKYEWFRNEILDKYLK